MSPHLEPICLLATDLLAGRDYDLQNPLHAILLVTLFSWLASVCLSHVTTSFFRHILFSQSHISDVALKFHSRFCISILDRP